MFQINVTKCAPHKYKVVLNNVGARKSKVVADVEKYVIVTRQSDATNVRLVLFQINVTKTVIVK